MIFFRFVSPKIFVFKGGIYVFSFFCRIFYNKTFKTMHVGAHSSRPNNFNNSSHFSFIRLSTCPLCFFFEANRVSTSPKCWKQKGVRVSFSLFNLKNFGKQKKQMLKKTGIRGYRFITGSNWVCWSIARIEFVYVFAFCVCVCVSSRLQIGIPVSIYLPVCVHGKLSYLLSRIRLRSFCWRNMSLKKNNATKSILLNVVFTLDPWALGVLVGEASGVSLSFYPLKRVPYFFSTNIFY